MIVLNFGQLNLVFPTAVSLCTCRHSDENFNLEY